YNGPATQETARPAAPTFPPEHVSSSRRPAMDLERYRAYLLLLARLQVDPVYRGKIDLSGVVQQALLKAHQAGDRFEEGGEGRRAAWLRRILANTLTDEVRKLHTDKRDLARERSLEAALEESSSRLEGWLAAEQSSPSRRVERDEQAVRLAEALAALPEAQREALVLQHWQGWTLNRIAEHLG